jgi:phosphoserine phosphatase RsbU/P
MSEPTPSASSPSRGLSLRWVIALLTVVPIVGVTGALVVLLTVTNQQVSEQLGSAVVESANARVRTEVTSYLQSAVRVSDLYERRLAAGVLLPDVVRDQDAWERAMLDDLVTNPDVASICFGNVRGETTWLLRNRDSAGKTRLEVGRVPAQTSPEDANAKEFEAFIDGGVGIALLRDPYRYDPRGRPWYTSAVQAAPKAVWTPVYFWFADTAKDESVTGTAYAKAIRNAEGEFLGVLSVDVTLGALSEFLRSLPLAQRGYAFMVDADGLLVAASHGRVSSIEGKRLSLAQSAEPAARAVATALAANARQSRQDRRTGSDTEPLLVVIDDTSARATIAPFAPSPGITWSIIAVLPESEFLTQAKQTRNRAIALGALAVVGASALGLLVAGRLARPLLQVREHVRRVGAGEFDSRIRLSAARELHELSTDLNQMSVDLKQRMEMRRALSLASDVQRSLLPESPPVVPGLDIAGVCSYCDETGGDYYDFVPLASSPTPQGGVLVTIADATGHGVAPALLMATARGAVRASLDATDHLGTLLARVNDLIASDNRHGKFVTMLLLRVGAHGASTTWASAGHDAPILYNPLSDTSTELGECGGPPLGIDVGLEFPQEHAGDLAPGSVLLAGTDGIWEARDAEKQMFGKERVAALLRAHAALPAREIAQHVVAAVTAHSAHAGPQDDITFVVIKCHPQRDPHDAALGTL